MFFFVLRRSALFWLGNAIKCNTIIIICLESAIKLNNIIVWLGSVVKLNTIVIRLLEARVVQIDFSAAFDFLSVDLIFIGVECM